VLRHALVRPITRFKVQHGRPVIREVLGELTCGAGTISRHIFLGVHGGIETVSTDDLEIVQHLSVFVMFWAGTHLVNVRRGDLAGSNEGIEALYDKLSALEPDEGTGRSAQG
jgi:hypothetical protein